MLVVILIFEFEDLFESVEVLSLTRPLKLYGMGMTLSLDRNRANREDEMGLVKRSYN